MQKTALFDVYEAHQARVVDFHDWALPVQFQGIVDEHQHTRKAASLFDCSHMGEFLIEGQAGIAALDRHVFSDYVGLKPGRCRYSAILNDRGGIIDDCVALRLDEERLYLVSNAGPLAEVSSLLCLPDIGAKNLSDSTAKIDLQGPMARDILLELGLDAVGTMRYWDGIKTRWQDHELVITRGGYTGELGYEIFVPNEGAVALWRYLMQHPAVKPAGLGARDTLRLEMGYPLNGSDLSPDRTPLESGMGRFIKWDKDFRGKAVLEEQRDSGSYPVLTAIRSKDRRAPRAGFTVQDGDREIGVVTSGTFGPSVGHGIGLAYLPQDFADPGNALNAGPRKLPVTTTRLPFYADGTCRIRF